MWKLTTEGICGEDTGKYRILSTVDVLRILPIRRRPQEVQYSCPTINWKLWCWSDSHTNNRERLTWCQVDRNMRDNDNLPSRVMVFTMAGWKSPPAALSWGTVFARVSTRTMESNTMTRMYCNDVTEKRGNHVSSTISISIKVQVSHLHLRNEDQPGYPEMN